MCPLRSKLIYILTESRLVSANRLQPIIDDEIATLECRREEWYSERGKGNQQRQKIIIGDC